MSTGLTSLWNKVLEEIKTEVSVANYGTILKQTHLVSLENNIATIGAPSFMIISLLQSRFSRQIKKLLSEHAGKRVDVLFVPKALPPADKKHTRETPLFSISESTPSSAEPTIGHLPRVRADFTFLNFAVSTSNQLAFTSAQAVALHIGKSYNPLFIYGPVGVGKTHLMCAIANDVYSKNPGKKIVYITSEEFTNEVIEAIKTHETAKMKKRFRSAYLLLIDDIQFIEGKEVIQEELFHTFNILVDQGSQICLSSDRPPHEIKRIEKRLSSRFAGGLTVDIGKPDLELKTAIVGIKAKKYGHKIPTDIALFLAEQAQDTRSLEGLLLRVVTQAATAGEPITLELAKKSLGAVIEEKRAHLHAEDVVKTVCDFYGIKPTQLKGPKRDAGLVRARQVTMYLLKEELRLTQVETGNLLGGRDHTTIMYGVDKIQKLVENKDIVYEDIRRITERLRG